MQLQQLRISQFRNYDHCELRFSKKLSVFLGKNGLGKTNVLEAIYMLGQGDSFRTSQWKTCVRMGQTQSAIAGLFTSERGWKANAQIALDLAGRRKHKWDGKAIRLKDLHQKVAMVAFGPHDHDLIKGSAGGRRDFLDLVATHVMPDHHDHSQELNRTLQQRLRVLKDEPFSHEAFDLWTQQLLKIAPAVIHGRLQILERILPHVEQIYSEISNQKAHITFSYENHFYDGKSISQIQTQLEDEFRDRAAIEPLAKRNLFGPQTHDIVIHLDGMETRQCASQGQSRSLILAMKLAHTELIKDCWGVEPIFIADDIASELDTERREFLLKHLLEKNVQVFLSAADPRFVPEDHDCDVFRVTVSSEDQTQVENHVRAAIIS